MSDFDLSGESPGFQELAAQRELTAAYGRKLIIQKTNTIQGAAFKSGFLAQIVMLRKSVPMYEALALSLYEDIARLAGVNLDPEKPEGFFS